MWIAEEKRDLFWPEIYIPTPLRSKPNGFLIHPRDPLLSTTQPDHIAQILCIDAQPPPTFP